MSLVMSSEVEIVVSGSDGSDLIRKHSVLSNAQ